LDDIQEGQGMAEGFIFEDWLASIDLCEETLEKLHKAKVRNADSVLLLSRYDITALKLDIGDRGTFRKAVRLLRVQFPADDDIANASISSQIDDSFDGGDPDHIHVQQGSQLDALNKLRVEQEKLSARQSQLPVAPSYASLHPVPEPLGAGVIANQSSIDQLSTLLQTLNLQLVPLEGPALQQPLILQPPVSVLQGASAAPASFLPGAGLLGSHAASGPANPLQPSQVLPFVTSSIGALPFSSLPAVSASAPFSALSSNLQSSIHPTTATLAQIPALKNITDASISASIKDLLGIAECGQLASGSKKGEKALLPVDFVSIIPGVVPPEEDIINQNNGVELIIRNVGARRPTPDKLTTGQYMEACHLILQILLPTFSLQDLTDYIEYMRQIGYFMQIFSISSVFALDHEHRKNVFAKKCSWSAINQCLATGTLKAKQNKIDQKVTQSQSKPSNGSKPVAPSGVPCPNFNDANRFCPFNPCRNPHRCSVDGCTQAHPAYKHGSNFRTNTNSTGTNG
jgi:hypothetical protein